MKKSKDMVIEVNSICKRFQHHRTKCSVRVHSQGVSPSGEKIEFKEAGRRTEILFGEKPLREFAKTGYSGFQHAAEGRDFRPRAVTRSITT